MKCVKEIVLKAMPSFRNDLMDSPMARLKLIGVNSVDDYKQWVTITKLVSSLNLIVQFS